MNSLERFSKTINYLNKEYFCRSLKDETTDDNGKYLDGHITDEEYLTSIKISNKFNMKNMGDYHDHHLKNKCFVIS